MVIWVYSCSSLRRLRATGSSPHVQGAAKHMGEEEQQSLELMRGIAEGKARLNSLVHFPDANTLSSSTNGGGGGRFSSPAQAPFRTGLQTQGSKGGQGKTKAHETGVRPSWAGGWS